MLKLSFEDEEWLAGFQAALELCYSMVKGTESKDAVLAKIFFFLDLIKNGDFEQLKALLDQAS